MSPLYLGVLGLLGAIWGAAFTLVALVLAGVAVATGGVRRRAVAAA